MDEKTESDLEEEIEFQLDKKTEDLSYISHYAYLEAHFEDYFSGKKDRNKMSKDLFYPAIDLWLFTDHYGIKGHEDLLDIVKAALRAEQKSRLYTKLKKKEAHKRKGRKSQHDAERIVKLVDEHFTKKYVKYLLRNKVDSKPNFALSFEHAKNKLEEKRTDGYTIEPETLRKIYYRNRIYPRHWLIMDAFNKVKNYTLDDFKKKPKL